MFESNYHNFWQNLPRPILGLAPMDGVSDAPFRFLISKYGNPSLTITEFTNVEGIFHGNIKGMLAFLYNEIERPVLAQLFGTDLDSYYKAALVVCAMGFDGIDINMGCPAKKVSERGAGAGLIRNPDLAKQIIRICWQASEDFANGKNPEDTNLPKSILDFIQQHKHNVPRRKLPVSVKTRIGIDQIVVEDWVKHLLEEKPVNITIHGRTLNQMYSGEANWEAIGKAAKIIKTTDTLVMGNGDIKDLNDAHQRITQYGLDGALIGRATFGDPWFFDPNTPYESRTPSHKLTMALEHCQKYAEIFGNQYFAPMKKHLGWYCRGFDGAKDVRTELMNCHNFEEAKSILQKSLANF